MGLGERSFTPAGMVFPVSSVIFDRLDTYKEILQGHTSPLMEYIEWRPTANYNVEVLNDTADLYRYFDATEAAEFFYSCVKHTVEIDLPREIDYLQRNDEALRRIADFVAMPDRLIQNIVIFILQNEGVLPKKRRRADFKDLTDYEVSEIETIVNEAFDGFSD